MNKMGQQINMICEPDLPGIFFEDFNELSSDLVPQSRTNHRRSTLLQSDNQELQKNSYTCTVCQKLIKGSTQLLTHVRTHTGKNSFSFQCKFCSKSFKDTSSLNIHIKNHNRDRVSKYGNAMRCCVCEINLPDPVLLRKHEESHSAEGPFRCRYCCSLFTLLKQFKMHIYRHQIQLKKGNNNRTKINSPVRNRCMQMVPKYMFTDHLQKQCQQSTVAIRNSIQPQQRLECSLCHKVFAKSYNLKRHVLVHQKYGHDQSNYSPTSSISNNSENFNIPELEVVKINSTAKKMFNQTLLKESTTLTLTPALLSNLNKLTNHINLAEPNLGLKKPPILININTSNPAKAAIEKNIKLELSEMLKIRKQSDLFIKTLSRDHPRMMNNSSVSSNTVSSTASNHEEPLVKKQIPLSSLQCLFCNKVLSDSFSLKVHMKTHASLKLFSCKYCKKSFTRASSLKGHIATHSDKNLVCHKCNISFENNVEAYSEHMKVKHLKAADLMREEIKKISDAMTVLKDQQNKVSGKVIEVKNTAEIKSERKTKAGTPRLVEIFAVQQSNGTPNGKIPKLKITIKKETLSPKAIKSVEQPIVESMDDGSESDSSSSSSDSSSSSSNGSSSSSSSSSSDNKDGPGTA